MEKEFECLKCRLLGGILGFYNFDKKEGHAAGFTICEKKVLLCNWNKCYMLDEEDINLEQEDLMYYHIVDYFLIYRKI